MSTKQQIILQRRKSNVNQTTPLIGIGGVKEIPFNIQNAAHKNIITSQLKGSRD